MSKTDIKECKCRLNELVDTAYEKDPIKTKDTLDSYEANQIRNKDLVFAL